MPNKFLDPCSLQRWDEMTAHEIVGSLSVGSAPVREKEFMPDRCLLSGDRLKRVSHAQHAAFVRLGSVAYPDAARAQIDLGGSQIELLSLATSGKEREQNEGPGPWCKLSQKAGLLFPGQDSEAARGLFQFRHADQRVGDQTIARGLAEYSFDSGTVAVDGGWFVSLSQPCRLLIGNGPDADFIGVNLSEGLGPFLFIGFISIACLVHVFVFGSISIEKVGEEIGGPANR